MGARWLLIGNSRWHWAEHRPEGLSTWHGPPMATTPVIQPRAWAAVGPLPAGVRLDPDRRVGTEEVPLDGAPPWLGVDRALGGWWAWSRWREPVLMVDAGTVLTFTRVDGGGRFRGGRLQAGLGLQLRAMAAHTAALPSCPVPPPVEISDPWPAATAAAMAVGVRLGLAAAILEAARAAIAADPGCRLVLTGGDAEVLLPALAEGLGDVAIPWEHRPDLCLEALAALRPAVGETLRPGPGRRGSDRPSPRPSP